MAELVIQPWDKEYWSKGARKRLYDEYQTNAMDRRLAEAEGMEGMNRASTEIADVRRHGYDLEKINKNYNNRLAEMDVGYGHDSALAEKQIQARAAENAKSHAAAAENLKFQLEKDDRDAIGALTTQYRNALRADNPNMSTSDFEMRSQEGGMEIYKTLQGGALQGKAAIDALKVKDPYAFAPGLGARVRQDIAGEEQAFKQAVMERYGLGGQQPAAVPAPGSRFPSSSAPINPGPQTGPRVLQWPPPKPKTAIEQLLEKYGGTSR